MNRYIYIQSPANDNKVKNIRKQYNDNLYDFHKRFTKLKTNIDKKHKKLLIKLIGFDGKVKHTYSKFNPKKITGDIDKMPMGNLRKKSLSLYANYKPDTTIKGFGFKNKKKAQDTIKALQNLNYKYQMNVVNTMINRAKYHPHINDNMREAILVFEKYKKKLKNKSSRLQS